MGVLSDPTPLLRGSVHPISVLELTKKTKWMSHQMSSTCVHITLTAPYYESPTTSTYKPPHSTCPHIVAVGDGDVHRERNRAFLVGQVEYVCLAKFRSFYGYVAFVVVAAAERLLNANKTINIESISV